MMYWVFRMWRPLDFTARNYTATKNIWNLTSLLYANKMGKKIL